MKRNLLAITIPVILFAGVANAAVVYNRDGNKVNLYGQVKAANVKGIGKNKNDKISPPHENGDQSYARIGFLGETQITENLVGYGRAEWEKRLNDSGIDARYTYAGFKFADYGSIDYGKNGGVLKDIFGYTDVLPEFGADGDYGTSVLNGRHKSVLTYRNDNLFGYVDGLRFAIQYKADNTAEDFGAGVINPLASTGKALGMNVEYVITDTGLTVGAGYAQEVGSIRHALTDESKKRKSYIAGVKYDLDGLYLGAIYAHTKHSDVKFNTIELVAQYAFDLEVGSIKPSIAYVQGKGKNLGLTDDEAVKYVEIGATYDFNENMSVIVDYKHNLIKDLRDSIAFGLVYRF